MDRREFLRSAGLTVAAASLGPQLSSLFGGTSAEAEALRGFTTGSILDLPAKEAPIDTIVVLMMENRSFDHFFGWLATDPKYIANGRQLHSRRFYVEGDQTQSFRDYETRKRVATYYLPDAKGEENPYRGCGHPDPGHGWGAGRAQRDGGFLAKESGNDEFALGFYRDPDMPLYAELARRFTVFDRYHCSLLGPTFPNREYLHSAQSGGIKDNSFPSGNGFEWATIWDLLADAGVPAAYYFVDLPTIALWGTRMLPYARHIEHFFADAAAGVLPNVVFVDPGFTTGLRTDDHPFADMRAGQRYVYNLVSAFTRSPHWESGAFFITYDEWGGFFDHVKPPILPDDRASRRDVDNFGQAGFRVPTMMASPYARKGFVDHRLYDHTSILRFIEWRFLGAPPEGPRGRGWYLTQRDRHARNIGASLRSDRPDPMFELDAVPQVPVTSAPCEGEELDRLPIPLSDPDIPKSPFEEALDAGYFERIDWRIDLKPLPV